nr:MAG TPA: hypothetical protein [Caudoviricetes sp.]
MKNLTKKERFDKVLAELKVLEGLDVIASYYYDHKNLYANQKDCKIDFDFLDLSIILVNPIAMAGTDKEDIINDYDTLLDASIYSALCGEIGYYFNNPVIIAFTNEYTDDKTVKEVKAIYKTYFEKQGVTGYMEVCNMFNLNMLGNVCDNEVIFDNEFKLRNDLDFLDYKIVNNYGEEYMIKKLVRDVTRQVWNYMKGPEVSEDNFVDILADDGVNVLATTIVSKVHKEMGSNILNDKIFTEFIVNAEYVPEDPVIAEAKKA